jgi:RNA polymerase sigma-70 factor (ECF subfamily)
MPTEAIPYPITSMQTAEAVTAAKTTTVDPADWVDEHGDYLFRYAVLRLRDDGVAEDCVQETFLSAIKALESYGGKATERTWLTGILKHKIVDHFRRSVRERPITEDETDLSGFENFFNKQGRWKDHWHNDFEPADWRLTPEAAIQQSEFMLVFQRCLSKLPERVAGVFALRELDGLESSEICETLELSSSNYWVMMHRARMGLRRCMELNWFEKAYK